VDLGDLPSPDKKDSPGNFIDLIQLEAELCEDGVASNDVAVEERRLERAASNMQRVKCESEATTLAGMREDLRAQAALVRASRSNSTVAEVGGRSSRGNDGNMLLGHRPPRCTASAQQPGSACSEPFPEPPSHCRSVLPSGIVGDTALKQPRSVFLNGNVALCPELPPSPLSPPCGLKAPASKTSTNSDFVQDMNIVCAPAACATTDDEFAAIRTEFSMVREQIDTFKRHGRSQLCALEEDLRALLHQQEEVETLAANVSTLVLAERSTQNTAVSVG